MKALLSMITFLLSALFLFCQENEHISTIREQQVESQADEGDIDLEDDDNFQHLHQFVKHPLNLNQAATEDLIRLRLLSDLQISHLLLYRQIFGKLLSIYELQGVPGWDMQTIQKILPFIRVDNNNPMIKEIREQWRSGDQKLLFRYSRVLERAKGFDKPVDSAAAYYLGGPGRMLFRYAYNYKNNLQWGFLGDKDAGEPFFKGKNSTGFDFYSFHLFKKGNGLIKAVALGDFRVSLGQGLIQWQSLALNKSADVMTVKRQSPVLGAYHAAGEHLFYRGMGITLKKRKWEATGFVSLRKISANTGVEPIDGEVQISSFHTSGFHRTTRELTEKNNLRQFTMGASIGYFGSSWRFAANAVNAVLSMPFQKADEPYNLFALKGRSFTNASIDYSYTYRNFHLFGEAALDKGMRKALLNGMLISLDSRADASLVIRVIDKKYESLYANAFTKNTVPVNENGLYAGISIRPSTLVNINAYADIFQFPWLKYRVDAPSSGNEYLVQLTYKPNKQVEVYTRFKNDLKEENRSSNILVMNQVDKVRRQSWRFHSSVQVSADLEIRNRCELSWYKKQSNAEQGFLIFMDGLFKPRKKPWTAGLRLLYFETEGYNARIYAYENDTPSSFSIPAFFGKGYRYYLNMHVNLSDYSNKPLQKKLQLECWLRFSQTIYPGKISTGSGMDLISGNKKSEVKALFMITF